MSHSICHNSFRHKAFTMIEIVVAIGILLILVAIVVVAVGRISGTAGTQATKVDLENLQSMLGELEGSGALTSTIRSDVMTAVVEAPADVTAAMYASSGSANITQPDPDPVTHRWHHPAVIETQKVMGKIRAIPKNRDALQRLPAEKLMKQQNDLGAAAYGDSKPIRTTGTPIARGIPDPPIPADTWGNPIIFVPGGGMLAADFDAAVGYKKGSVVKTGSSGNYTYYRALNDGKLTAPPGNSWEEVPAQYGRVTAPGNRPFFASAGPDGDFRTFDDNVYSFGD